MDSLVQILSEVSATGESSWFFLINSNTLFRCAFRKICSSLVCRISTPCMLNTKVIALPLNCSALLRHPRYQDDRSGLGQRRRWHLRSHSSGGGGGEKQVSIAGTRPTHPVPSPCHIWRRTFNRPRWPAQIWNIKAGSGNLSQWYSYFVLGLIKRTKIVKFGLLYKTAPLLHGYHG